MEIVYGEADLARYVRDAVKVSNDSPVLLDRFLDNAVECDVDIIADAQGNVLIGGVMEHIEEAGVHSGDSSCSLPPYSLSAETQAELRRQVVELAKALNVVGLMNTQFAIQTSDEGADTIYLLEVNPRASRTVPFSPRPPACRWPRSPRAAWPARAWPSRARPRKSYRTTTGEGSDLPVRRSRASTRSSGRRCAPPVR